MNRFRLAASFARRELRGGLAGFRIFFACLVLGVTTIAGVGSVAEAMLTGLSQQGRVLLGGDVSVHLVHREMTANERTFIAARGEISEVVSMRAMAYALKGQVEGDRQLIELKAVDQRYPLYGAVMLAPQMTLPEALACGRSGTETICGAVAEQTLLDRLHISRGGLMKIGSQDFRIAAVLANEPDRISGGFTLGPHVLVSDAGLSRTGLVMLGSLIEYGYRVAMPPAASISQFKDQAQAAFPDSGWEIHDRNDAAPGIKRFVEQITMFLTLVGLTALAVGGVGAGQAISAFLDRKRAEIAILKSLGAEGGLVFLTYFFQVMAIAFAAVLVGLIGGAALPFLVEATMGSELPIQGAFAVYAAPLVLGGIFGIFSAAAFAIPPLARAQEISPAGLFRDMVAPVRTRGRLPYLIMSAGAAAIVIALALELAPSFSFAAYFLAGIAGALVVLRMAAEVLRRSLKLLPRAERPSLRLALANLTRPGASTSSVVVALGLGLTLLAAVTLLDRTISAQVRDSLPGTAPTFFFIDIQPDEIADFDHTVARFHSVSNYKEAPMIRGRIVALKGMPAKDARVAADSRWALNGDRGITYAATVPKGAVITEGQWWRPDYAGPTLISLDANIAKGMDLKIGDTMTLNVLGREIEGHIANLREVNFTNGQQNFILVLSPGLIDKAPHSFLASLRVEPRDEEPLYRAITDKFPNVSTVRVKDAITQVNALLQELGAGVRAASLLTILAGLFVLAGAIAAGQRARLYDSTVLKVLGATRGQIAAVYAIEYGVIGLLTGLLALGAGTLAAWLVTRQIFDVTLVFDLSALLTIVIGGGAVTLAFGLVAAWAALGAKPAALLRSP